MKEEGHLMVQNWADGTKEQKKVGYFCHYAPNPYLHSPIEVDNGYAGKHFRTTDILVKS